MRLAIVVGHLAGYQVSIIWAYAPRGPEDGFHAVQRVKVHLQVCPQEPRRAEQIKIVEVHGQAAALVHVQRGEEVRINYVNNLGNKYSLSPA